MSAVAERQRDESRPVRSLHPHQHVVLTVALSLGQCLSHVRDFRDRLAAVLLGELPPPRHAQLRGFRVLLIDSDPLLPTDKDVRAGIERLADHLGKSGLVAVAMSFRGIGVMIVLLAVTVANKDVGIAAVAIYAISGYVHRREHPTPTMTPA